MKIIAEAWPAWTERTDLVKAAKRVGISDSGLNVDWMQQDKFERAEILLGEQSEKEVPSTPLVAESPVGVRKGTSEYHRLKLESLEKKVAEHMQFDSSDVEGLLSLPKVKPKIKATEKVRITQIHGSMTAKDALSMIQKIAREKDEKKKKQEEATKKKEENRSLFYRCREVCSCQGSCKAKQLKECPKCKNVMKSQCSKAGCRSEDGTIPTMNVPLKAVQPKAKRCRRALLDVIEDVSSEESEPEDEEEFLGIIEDTDEEIEFASEKVNEEENRDAMEESDEYEMGEASGHSFKK